jgi:hypothetical protein
MLKIINSNIQPIEHDYCIMSSLRNPALHLGSAQRICLRLTQFVSSNESRSIEEKNPGTRD